MAAYLPAKSVSRMTNKFSAFDSSAAFVKLNEPVMTTWPSITMTLLWAIAWAASMNVGIDDGERLAFDGDVTLFDELADRRLKTARRFAESAGEVIDNAAIAVFLKGDRI